MTVVTESEDEVKKLGDLLREVPTYHPPWLLIITLVAIVAGGFALGFFLFKVIR